ncbi:MAG: glycosyltransferase family 2 protein [Paracoccaceae bacterium]
MSGPDPDPGAIPVVALAHNEANILPAFLDHYRQLCRPAFLIVDDRSTDTTPDILAAAADVTVFRPVEGSTYARDKAIWRSELLDAWGAGRWCLVPDLDEHFVHPGAERQGFSDYLAQLDAEGAEAVAMLMLDMYADRPLEAHRFEGATPRRCARVFLSSTLPTSGPAT